MSNEGSEKSDTPKEVIKEVPKDEGNDADKRGVCYLQSIPPQMTQEKLRKMLSKRFVIERIYLEKEHEAVTKARSIGKGHKLVRFTEGWIEFERKKDAKMAALALNNQLIGGKKRKNAFHDDRWNLRYLSGFKWRHLTEKLVYDQKMRQQRLKTDMARANKELAYYQEKAELAM